MLVLVQIDLSRADIALFDTYEERVLALLPRHGARLHMRVRSKDGAAETHVLEFPDSLALERFRGDPERIAAQPLWEACGATSVMSEVEVVGSGTASV